MFAFKGCDAIIWFLYCRGCRLRGAHGRGQDPKTPVEQAFMRGLVTHDRGARPIEDIKRADWAAQFLGELLYLVGVDRREIHVAGRITSQSTIIRSS